MAVTIAREANVAVVPGTATEIISTRAGRIAASIQLQADGLAWIALGVTAEVGVGIRIGGWDVVDVGILVDSLTGDAVNFYEGPVSLLWEGGGVNPNSNKAPTTANVRVIEGT